MDDGTATRGPGGERDLPGEPAPSGLVPAVPPSDRLLARYAPLRPVRGLESLFAHQSSAVMALWEAWEAETGAECPVPYWALVWPAAVVLGRWCLAHPERLAGRRVLDLGCGGAVASLAAARAGAAAVTANDFDPAALHLARRNAAVNRVELAFELQDRSRRADPPPEDLVLVADLFYQRATAPRLRRWLLGAAAASTEVLLADGGRDFAPRDDVEPILEEEIPVDAEVEGVPLRRVRLGRLRPPG